MFYSLCSEYIWHDTILNIRSLVPRYPLWGFTTLAALLLLPSILPAHGLSRYLLKTSSAPHWMKRMGLSSPTKASMSDSWLKNSSLHKTSHFPEPLPSYRPDREVGADFPRLPQKIPASTLGRPPSILERPASTLKRPARTLETTGPVELSSVDHTPSQQDQVQKHKEGRPVLDDLEAQSQSPTP